MPVIWQSSQRPMYVRTIWVNGNRHAILTNDDPFLRELRLKQRRPFSSNVYNSQRHLQIKLEDTDKEPNIEKLDLKDIDQESEEELVLKSKPQPLSEYETSRSKHNNFTEMKALRANKTARTETNENTELSDRVLQWLDLAGKVDLLAPQQEAKRMSNPRHSWPEIQRRSIAKYKAMAEAKTKTDKNDTPTVGASEKHEKPDIDRQDVYVATQANTIENYARQTRNVKINTRIDNVSNKNVKLNKNRDVRMNVSEVRRKVAAERNAVEKQYAELVSKNILPEFTKIKKQVHIFMPEVPKKTDSNLTSRTTSLLSQAS